MNSFKRVVKNLLGLVQAREDEVSSARAGAAPAASTLSTLPHCFLEVFRQLFNLVGLNNVVVVVKQDGGLVVAEEQSTVVCFGWLFTSFVDHVKEVPERYV